MGDMLSQAEIDALLNGASSSDTSSNTSGGNSEGLSAQEIDALGEIGNISMGTSATTLFTLLGHKVTITTPQVSVSTWEKMVSEYNLPVVAVRVQFTQGLNGANLLILKDEDVKIITDLMMGGDGSNISGELSDLHLSAISEAMNQMIGSSSTSMSSLFDKRIDISPPKAFNIKTGEEEAFSEFDRNQTLVKISFKMIVGNLIDSEIMQLIPLDFAKNLVDNLLNMDTKNSGAQEPIAPPRQQPQQQQPTQQFSGHQQPQQNSQQSFMSQPQQQMGFGHGNDNMNYHEQPRNGMPVNVQPAQFQSFDDGKLMLEKKNIGIIMDVPLQVTVELGRTNKLIRDILEFGPGSIIELDKLAGEPVDILVNGKVIAKGEVVVIDESFGVRITDIIHPSKRL
ncbi:MAG: flagellar motor switch phosphatase FliY [Bacillota bacterium]|nr:flagellar motor switch phosphatase FliY [Bacillota bacterium]